MKPCKELVIKEEFLPIFDKILKSLSYNDIIKFCGEVYSLQPSERYIKSLFTSYKNTGKTQHFFSAVKHHLRNLYYNIDYAKFYSDDEPDIELSMKIIEKHNNYNYPESFHEDFLNYFQK